jgi:hypothetical protein
MTHDIYQKVIDVANEEDNIEVLRRELIQTVGWLETLMERQSSLLEEVNTLTSAINTYMQEHAACDVALSNR